MVFPVAHADPTELVSALRAGHMIAPLVLLDVLLALRADFRVGGDPVDIFRLSISLLIPQFCCLAVAGFMRVLSTTEAEFGSAVADDIVEHAAHIGSLAAKFALHVGAPLNILVVVGEGLAEPLPIRLFVLRRT